MTGYSGTTPYGGTPSENERMQAYFATLPAYIQENIKQSGVDMQTEAQLRQCVAALTAHHAQS